MSKEATIYEICSEFIDIAKKIIDCNSSLFPSIDSNEFIKTIRCVQITNKERKEGAELFKIKGIGMPVKLFADCAFIIEIYKNDFEQMDGSVKEWFVLSALRCIGQDEETTGKIEKSHLIQEDYLIVSTCGVDWKKRYGLPKLTDINSAKSIQWGKYGVDGDTFAISANYVQDKMKKEDEGIIDN